MLVDRGRERGGVLLEMADDLVPQHEAIRIRPGIFPAWKLNRPVRRDQAEAIPPIPPRLTDPTSLNHQMLNTTRTQLVADRQTSLAAPHHHHIRRLIHHGTDPERRADPSGCGLGSAPVSAKRVSEPFRLDAVGRVEVMALLEHLELEVRKDLA